MHQKAVLIQVLRAFPEQRVGVEYCASAGDALAYAQDFFTIFRAVGWDVNDVQPATQATAQAAGLAIVVSQSQGVPPGAEALRDALRIYGIEAETIWDAGGHVSVGAFALRVGSDASVH